MFQDIIALITDLAILSQIFYELASDLWYHEIITHMISIQTARGYFSSDEKYRHFLMIEVADNLILILYSSFH